MEGNIMIKVENVTKKFDDFIALKNMNCEISEGCIYGLVGSNGAGKSTFLRLITGIYKPDEGKISIDEKPVWENQEAKSDFVFVPDELYFISQATLNKMAKLYNACYPNFSFERYKMLLDKFGLDPKKKIASFSKGMKRQAAIICALSCQTKYLFFDETFDGLDPIARNIAKRLIYRDMCDFGSTVIMTSHSLRELEDTCDRFAMLYQGKIVFQNDLADAKSQLFKVQLAFARQVTPEDFKDVELLSFTKQGSIVYVLVRGEAAETSAKIEALKPLIMDMLPLSIEEVFTYELSSLGYNFDEIK